MAYTLKADTEQVVDTKPNAQGFGSMEFAEPGCIIYCKGDELVMLYDEQIVPSAPDLISHIEAIKPQQEAPNGGVEVIPHISRAEYIQQVNKNKQTNKHKIKYMDMRTH